ncbi:hypothetical protein LCGC14_2811050 [marine sediment metagenome]|uniref:Uncharacterized protein n=1 Tax=marine sediment metagenome TaxID=412755 RepID=A0A0F8Z6M7_9ZZZZ
MSEQAREAERRLIREHPPEENYISDLERQLAEAQEIYDALGKLEVLKGFREQLNGFSGHSSILIDKLKVTIDAILRGTKEDE